VIVCGLRNVLAFVTRFCFTSRLILIGFIVYCTIMNVDGGGGGGGGCSFSAFPAPCFVEGVFLLWWCGGGEGGGVGGGWGGGGGLSLSLLPLPVYV